MKKEKLTMANIYFRASESSIGCNLIVLSADGVYINHEGKDVTDVKILPQPMIIDVAMEVINKYRRAGISLKIQTLSEYYLEKYFEACRDDVLCNK